MAGGLSVFISYARKDGRIFAGRLRDQLSELNFQIWQDVVSLEGGEQWWEQIKTAIENADAMVLVLTPEALASDNVRREWVYARKVGTHIFPITDREDIFDIAPRWIQKTDIFVLSSNHPNLKETTERFLSQLKSPHPRRPVPLMSAPTPRQYNERSELHQELLSKVLDENISSPREGIVALVGIGGFGKTTLAQGVCNDPEVVEAFIDGILWATFGEEVHDLISKLTALVRQLTHTQISFNTEEEAAHSLRELLADRECLFVLDDVWNSDDIRLFLAPDHCTRLITTRHMSVASLIGDSVLTVTEMKTEEAVKVLVNHLPQKYAPDESDYLSLETLAQRLGEWPLLLDIIGGTLRKELMQGLTLQEALNGIQEGLSEEGLIAFDAENAKERNRAFGASVNASLRRYSDDQKLRLYELCIFPEDISIPETVIALLWSKTAGMTRHTTRKLLQHFSGQFFTPVGSQNGVHYIRFHDAMREYLMTQFGNEAKQATHISLLSAANPAMKPWHEVVDSGYLFDYLVYHLLAAGLTDEIIKLFADEGWMRERFRQNGNTYVGYIADLELAWQAAQAQALREIDTNTYSDLLAQCLRYGLLRTRINSLADNFAPELLVQAVKTQVWDLGRAIETATNISDTRARIQAYCELLKLDFLTLEQRSEILLRAKKTASEISSFELRLEALSKIIEFVDKTAQQDIVALFLEGGGTHTHYQETRVKGLARISRFTSGATRTKLVKRAFKLADEITHNWSRSRAFLQLALALHGNQRQEALQKSLSAALVSEQIWGKVEMLVSLAPYLQDTLLEKAMAAASILEPSSLSVRALAALLPKATRNYEEVRLLYRQANELEFERDVARTIAILIPYLKRDDRREALEIAISSALKITISSIQKDVFASLAPHLDAKALEHVFRSLVTAKDESNLTNTLSKLAQQASSKTTLIDLAFEIWQELTDETDAAYALYSLAPMLDENQLFLVLDRVTSMTFVTDTLTSLVYIVPYLPENLKAFSLKLSIDCFKYNPSGHDFSVALQALAPYLSDYQRKRLLKKCVLATQDDEESVENVFALLTLSTVATGRNKKYLMRQVWETMKRWLDEDNDEVGYLFEYELDGFDEEISLEALLTLDAIGDYSSFRVNIVEFSLKLPKQIAEKYIEQVLMVADTDQDDSQNRQLISLLAKHSRKDLADRLLTIGRSIKNHRERARALSDLLPLMENPETILDEIKNAIVLQLFSLRSLSTYYILQLIEDISSLSPSIINTSQINSIARHIEEICWRWEWQ